MDTQHEYVTALAGLTYLLMGCIVTLQAAEKEEHPFDFDLPSTLLYTVTGLCILCWPGFVVEGWLRRSLRGR